MREVSSPSSPGGESARVAQPSQRPGEASRGTGLARSPKLAAEDGSRSPHAAHAVDAAARRGRRRTEVDAAARRGVRVEPGDRPGEELAEILEAAVDVAADIVRVVGLDLGRQADGPGEDRIPEAGREPLDLGLDPGAHVERGAARDVAVRPAGVPAVRGAARVEAARLDDIVEQTIRALEFSILAKYAFGLAQLFNAFYHRYQILHEEDAARRRWRAAGVAYFRTQLTKALELMGIDVPVRM